jgi:hypothetical protein
VLCSIAAALATTSLGCLTAGTVYRASSSDGAHRSHGGIGAAEGCVTAMCATCLLPDAQLLQMVVDEGVRPAVATML